jgi:hypothetical protein
VGEFTESDILFQLESAPDGCVSFEELVRPESILLGKFVAIDTLLQPESRAAEFRNLSIWQFRIGPFLVFPFTRRVERPSLWKFEIRRCTFI